MVRWIIFDATGTDHGTVTAGVAIESQFPEISWIKPGQTVIVMPAEGVLTKPLPRVSDEALHTIDHAHRLRTFTGAAKVEVLLDGVRFDTGQFVGPDLEQEYEPQTRWLPLGRRSPRPF